MNRNSLIATIRAVCHEKLSRAEEPNGNVPKYISIFDNPAGQGCIGITEEGYWCDVYAGTIRTVNGIDNQRILFSLLQNPLQEIVALIKAGLAANKLPGIISVSFPFDEILLASLQTSWDDWAMKWIEDGYPLNDELRLLMCDNDKQSKFWLNTQHKRLGVILGL